MRCQRTLITASMFINDGKIQKGRFKMRYQRTLIAASIVGIALAAAVTAFAAGGPGLSPKEQLGKNLLFDTNLSTPPGQACAACHGPEVGYTGPDAAINAAGAVYEGAMGGRFGNSHPPSAPPAGARPP